MISAILLRSFLYCESILLLFPIASFIYLSWSNPNAEFTSLIFPFIPAAVTVNSSTNPKFFNLSILSLFLDQDILSLPLKCVKNFVA